MSQTSYPVVLTNLDGARCVVFGGGAVAERKVAGLLAAAARTLVVSPTLTATLEAWRASGTIEHLPRTYVAADLAGAALVIVATDDVTVNLEIAAEARRRGTLVNVASDPDAGSFHTVATVRRGDLLITVSTGGQSPALAAHVRAELAERYGPEYGDVVAAAAALRAPADSALPPTAHRASVAWLCSAQARAWLREGRGDLVAEGVRRAGALAPSAPEGL